MRSQRTKAVSINKKTKKIVHERDGGQCIFCRAYVDEFYANAHVIQRSGGGLGVEQNIVTACPKCHGLFDHSTQRTKMMAIANAHIQRHYPNYNRLDVIYRKGGLNVE